MHAACQAHSPILRRQNTCCPIWREVVGENGLTTPDTPLLFLISAAALCAQTGFKPAWTKQKPALAEQLQDAWTITEIGGEAIDSKSAPITVLFLDTEYFIKRGPDTLEAGTYTLTPQGDATWIDFRIREGENAGKSQFGLVRIDGRELRWCMGEAGSRHRPVTFANAATGNYSSQTIVVAVRAAAKAAASEKPADILARLQGRWQITSVDGKLPGAEFDRDIVTISGDHFRWEFRKGAFGGTVRLDATTRPMQIDFESATDANEVYRGIFEVRNAMLRLHLIEGKDAKRPKDFSDPECSAYLLAHVEDRPADGGTPAIAASSPPPAAPVRPPVTAGAASLRDRIQGAWRVTEADGRAPSVEIAWKFTSDTYQFTVGRTVMFAGHWKLDTQASPAAIDLSIEDAQGNSSGIWRGIVDIQNGHLRLCVPNPENTSAPRPTAFSHEGSLGLFEAVRQ